MLLYTIHIINQYKMATITTVFSDILYLPQYAFASCITNTGLLCTYVCTFPMGMCADTILDIIKCGKRCYNLIMCIIYVNPYCS